MTQFFQPVKVPAQDDPCTVDQVRLLSQNNNYLRAMWRNMIFAAAWKDGEVTGNILEDGVIGPEVTYPKGLTGVRVALCVKNSSGGAYDATFAFNINDSFLAGYDYAETVNIGTGVQWLEFDIDLDYGNTFTNEYEKGGFAIEVTGTGAGTTFMYHVGIWGTFSEEQTVDPQLYEVASNLHLRTPAADLNALGTVPQFLGGWLSSGDGDQIARDAGAATPESFRLYHLLDYADDQLTEEKQYGLDLSKRGTTDTPANDFVAKLYSHESGDNNSESIQVYDSEIVRVGVADVAGESWSTSANESAILADVYTDGGGADNSYLMGVAFSAWDSTPYTTARSQGAHRTACDSAFFEALPGSTIDYETINGIGLAQFNNFFRRAGQCQAIMFREGEDFNLTTTLVDFWRFNQYIRNGEVWFTNKHSSDTLKGHICIAASLAAGTSDVEIELSTTAAGDSDTVSFSLVAGMNYLEQAFEIEVDNAGAATEWITAQIRDKTSASTVKIYAVWIGCESFTDTY